MDQEIKVGDGATFRVGNDSYAYTVIAVQGKTLVVQRDRSIVTNAPKEYGDHVEYRYEPNEEGITHVITLRKDGRWRIKGDSIKSRCTFSIGHRRTYYDPHS